MPRSWPTPDEPPPRASCAGPDLNPDPDSAPVSQYRSSPLRARPNDPLGFIALAAFVPLVTGCQDPGTPAPEELVFGTTGSQHWVFQGTPLAAERPLDIWAHVPESAHRDSPVVFVLHGMGRNGEQYRNAWVQPAETHGFVVIVPEFSSEHYPGADHYNLGRIFQADGSRRDPSLWSYSQIEPVFQDARARLGLARERFHLYGHSAGSQFAHRYLMFLPDAPVDRVVLANAGWYTMPDPAIPWPYGVGWGGGEPVVTDDQIRSFLGRDVVVLLGDQDIDPEDSGLRNTPGAVAQGLHRFDRGHHYFERTRELAAVLQTVSPWQLDTVPGVGHSNARMAPQAALVLMASEY
jgi:pimeloyl-ACP methyl ester carboxylesterase